MGAFGVADACVLVYIDAFFSNKEDNKKGSVDNFESLCAVLATRDIPIF